MRRMSTILIQIRKHASSGFRHPRFRTPMTAIMNGRHPRPWQCRQERDARPEGPSDSIKAEAMMA